MKVLVCITGNLRGGSEPAKSLEKYVLAPLDADLALCIGRCGDHPYKRLAKYIWEIDEPEDWSEIWDRVGTRWRTIKRDLRTGLWGGVEGRGSGAIVFAFRYLLKEKLQELDLCSKYDRFLITRSDHVYVNDQTPCGSGLHIPTGEDYGGITDRHMMVDSENIVQVLSILEYMNETLPETEDKNPERMFCEFYVHLGLCINRYPRNMFTVARLNEQTHWRKPREKYKGGLYLKYPSEFDEIIKNSRGLRRMRLKIGRSFFRVMDLRHLSRGLRYIIRRLKEIRASLVSR